MVLIKGMEMPKCCGECNASGTGVCRKWSMKYAKTFPPDCPLISLDSVIEQMEALKHKRGYDARDGGIDACITILRGLENA